MSCTDMLVLSGGSNSSGTRVLRRRGAPAQVQQLQVASVGQPVQLPALPVQGGQHLLRCPLQADTQRGQQAVNLQNAAAGEGR